MVAQNLQSQDGDGIESYQPPSVVGQRVRARERASNDDSEGAVTPEETYQDREWLHAEYVGNGRTMADIASELDVSSSTIRNWLDRHGIDTRSQSAHLSDGDTEKLRDESWLETQYAERELTIYEIAADLDVSATTVSDWLDRHGIDARTQSEAQSGGDISLLHDESWLRERYVDRELSAQAVADEAGVSKAAVYSWLSRHGIETRSLSEATTDGDTALLQDPGWLREQYHDEGRSTYDIAAECDVTRPTVCNWMRRHGIQFRDQTDGDVEQLLDGEWLREQYCEQDRPTTAIADELGVDHRTVRKYMDKHGIDRKYRGEHHHMWKGGGVEYYGPSWPQQRAKTLRRDDFECQNCGIGRDDHYEKFDLDLNVHHIQPFRTFDSAAIANRLGNLVTLCHSCHLEVEHANEVSVR